MICNPSKTINQFRKPVDLHCFRSLKIIILNEFSELKCKRIIVYKNNQSNLRPDFATNSLIFANLRHGKTGIQGL